MGSVERLASQGLAAWPLGSERAGCGVSLLPAWVSRAKSCDSKPPPSPNLLFLSSCPDTSSHPQLRVKTDERPRHSSGFQEPRELSSTTSNVGPTGWSPHQQPALHPAPQGCSRPPHRGMSPPDWGRGQQQPKQLPSTQTHSSWVLRSERKSFQAHSSQEGSPMMPLPRVPPRPPPASTRIGPSS